ncbi:MAG TPA: SDR family NAD(P)-dependent oxidoreductase, partial [Ignavibacteriaceae bacterium]|nr:SDR family NAD(P)-dependent oxidoreductase [Ignavibacteriaceae bacterium]
ILITGGTSGIGRGFAEEFSRRGNTVITCGRREERLQEITAEYPDIITTLCDVSVVEEREALYQWVVENYPDINILINNAGIQLPFDLTKEVDMSGLNAEIDVNLVAPIHLSSLFAQNFKEKAESAVINISSGLAFVPVAVVPVYCATKAAIHSYTMSLRHQLKNSSVKVFEIIPPSVDSELGQERRKDKNQTHGGMPVNEFVKEAIEAIENDKLEAAISQAKNLREKGELLFDGMNERVRK